MRAPKKGALFYLRGIILLFSVYIGGEIKKPAAYNQPISSKSKTDCQKTTLSFTHTQPPAELKYVTFLIIKAL